MGQWLSRDNALITSLFDLLADPRTFDAAVGLLEEVLGMERRRGRRRGRGRGGERVSRRGREEKEERGRGGEG